MSHPGNSVPPNAQNDQPAANNPPSNSPPQVNGSNHGSHPFTERPPSRDVLEMSKLSFNVVDIGGWTDDRVPYDLPFETPNEE